MVQELAYENSFPTMFQASQQRMNAYNPSMPGSGVIPPGLPFGYGGGHHHQYDYSAHYDNSMMPPQSGTPSPTSSWSQVAASMYHPQAAPSSRHTPPGNGLEEWQQQQSQHHQQQQQQTTQPISQSGGTPFGLSSTGLPVSISQNGQSTFSYRPSPMVAPGLSGGPFSNVHSDLNPYGMQSPPSSSMGVPPTSQSPSPVGSGGSHHGGVGSSPISRQSRVPYDWLKRQGYHNAPHSGKTRTKDKYRIVYSEYQKVELEKEYLYSKYITIQRKAELARSIGLSERQVKIWFQNRRAKERKQKRKREDAIASVHSPEHHSDMKDIEPIKVEPSQEYIPTVNPQMHMHHHLSSPV